MYAPWRTCAWPTYVHACALTDGEYTIEPFVE